VRSMAKALTSGVSPSADLCVILPAGSESPDVLAKILDGASDQACATMVLPPGQEQDVSLMWHGVHPRLGAAPTSMTADELTGRIHALCQLRHPLMRMRVELRQLRQRDEQPMLDARERDEQLRLASQIQQELLPVLPLDLSPLNVTTLYLPADHVSGDIY